MARRQAWWAGVACRQLPAEGKTGNWDVLADGQLGFVGVEAPLAEALDDIHSRISSADSAALGLPHKTRTELRSVDTSVRATGAQCIDTLDGPSAQKT